jgi:hypothetical protein
MPIGIFLYEINSSPKPNILIDYYLGKKTVSNSILKELYEKHKKGIIDATVQEGEIIFYSSMVEEKKDLFLGFILKKDEDVISLKSVFKEIQAKITQNYESLDKAKMKEYLKETLDSISDMMEKLTNPELIKEQLNHRTKKLLDENNIEKAKELINLGETIPYELSELVEEAEEYFKAQKFRKAKKKFLKAADHAELIEENRIVSFLRNKANKVGRYPELLDEREDLQKQILAHYDKLDDLSESLQIYEGIIPLIKRLMEIANIINQSERYIVLSSLLNEIKHAARLANQLQEINKKLMKKDLF